MTKMEQVAGNTQTDLSKNTALTKLRRDVNRLTSLGVNGCISLTSLDCHDNQLTSLDLSNNTALTELNCGGNDLTRLIITVR